MWILHTVSLSKVSTEHCSTGGIYTTGSIYRHTHTTNANTNLPPAAWALRVTYYLLRRMTPPAAWSLRGTYFHNNNICLKSLSRAPKTKKKNLGRISTTRMKAEHKKGTIRACCTANWQHPPQQFLQIHRVQVRPHGPLQWRTRMPSLTHWLLWCRGAANHPPWYIHGHQRPLGTSLMYRSPDEVITR